MKEYYSVGEQRFARLFSRTAAWFVRLGIIVGALMGVMYITWVVENVPDWGWEDFANMPGFWIWTEGFLQLGIPYLFIRRLIRFLNPDIDDAYEAYREEHISLMDRLIPSPKMWKFFNPLDREYAMQYYARRTFGAVDVSHLTDKEIRKIPESNDEICHRIKVRNYRAICNQQKKPFSYVEAERAIYAEEHPIAVSRTQEASDQYQRSLQAQAAKNGWDGWKDDPNNRGNFVPNEDYNTKFYRLINEGKIKI